VHPVDLLDLRNIPDTLVKKIIKKTRAKIRAKIPPIIPPKWDNAWVAARLKDIERTQKIIISDQQDLDESLTELKRETAIVLSKIQELQRALGPPCPPATDNVSPELEKAVNAVYAQAIKIDDQVPDNNVQTE
jgi:hypothetical protein